jgi:hypothetical protein
MPIEMCHGTVQKLFRMPQEEAVMQLCTAKGVTERWFSAYMEVGTCSRVWGYKMFEAAALGCLCSCALGD